MKNKLESKSYDHTGSDSDPSSALPLLTRRATGLPEVELPDLLCYYRLIITLFRRRYYKKKITKKNILLIFNPQLGFTTVHRQSQKKG